MTLSEVSDLTGLSIPMISRLERGQRSLRPENRVIMARRLGVPVRALFEVEALEERPA
jgi:transcriptional regulator with XRE-family HTH domain